ncbi:MAG: hypothetical protein FWE04_01585 [Oscillospiraceae bacterium]|nr:hypothetical protein [Oscillospiraceae bacterium]
MSVHEITITARDYRLIQAEIKELEAQADALKQSMIKEMDTRQVDELQAGEFSIKYKLVESKRLDTTRLKAENPAVYETYAKSSVSARFQVA